MLSQRILAGILLREIGRARGGAQLQATSGHGNRVIWGALLVRSYLSKSDTASFALCVLRRVKDHIIDARFLAFHMYHAVKVGHRGVVLIAMETSDFASSHQVALSSSRAALTLLGQGL